MTLLFPPLCLVLAVLSFLSSVLGDTEIVNFHLPLSTTTTRHITPPDVPLLILSPSETITINLTSSSPERWFMLDFGDSTYTSWTIRASWPGSSPTRIKFIEPFSPGYFIIHSSSLSPPFPHPLLQHIPSYLKPYFPSSTRGKRKVRGSDDFETLLQVTLEPLHLGVIPQTAIPAIGLIVLFALGAGVCVPSIIHILETARDWADQKQVVDGKNVKME
nr:uncharacterized protein CI109_006605 [Kwoniella shandongensis]KAA5525054.1 hypothetical protein CI109_006605 [Kwoniella shandongensis]